MFSFLFVLQKIRFSYLLLRFASNHFRRSRKLLYGKERKDLLNLFKHEQDRREFNDIQENSDRMEFDDGMKFGKRKEI